MTIVWAILLGGLFGFALYYAGASNPSKLTAMLRLEYLTLMKIIIFAIGFASVLLALANIIGIFRIEHFHIKAVNLAVILGGIVFGIGFGWAGTCPGTSLSASMGIGWKKAVMAIVGGLIGAFCFTLSYGWWKGIGVFDAMNVGQVTLFRLSDKFLYWLPGSFWGLGLVGIIMMIVAVCIRDKS